MYDLKWGCFCLEIFLNDCYFHQVEMISVIKVSLGVALFGLQDVNVLRVFYSV